uniref:hypothetical protein n=1 Tax=Clostridium faecium TaxID=2762223 RepID=UPI0036F40841
MLNSLINLNLLSVGIAIPHLAAIINSMLSIAVCVNFAINSGFAFSSLLLSKSSLNLISLIYDIKPGILSKLALYSLLNLSISLFSSSSFKLHNLGIVPSGPLVSLMSNK